MIMGLSNKKKIIYTILFLLILISFYFILFPKHKDYYNLKFDISFVKFKKQKNGNYIVISEKTKNKDLLQGISLKINKIFLHKSDSKRLLFSGSIEKGINGIDKKKQILIYCDKNKANLCKSLYLISLDKSYLTSFGNRELQVFNKRITLENLINDFNSNRPYTKGVSFYNSTLYFIFEKNPDRSNMR